MVREKEFMNESGRGEEKLNDYQTRTAPEVDKGRRETSDTEQFKDFSSLQKQSIWENRS